MGESGAIAPASKFAASSTHRNSAYAMIDTLPIRIDYSRHSISSMTTVSTDSTIALIISLRVTAGTLSEAAAYTTLDEHVHIDVGK